MNNKIQNILKWEQKFNGIISSVEAFDFEISFFFDKHWIKISKDRNLIFDILVDNEEEGKIEAEKFYHPERIKIKIKLFEYMIEKLIDWWDTKNPGVPHEFDKIQIFKFLFFISAASADKDNEGLFSLFDKHYAYIRGRYEEEVAENLNLMEKFYFDENQKLKSY